MSGFTEILKLKEAQNQPLSNILSIFPPGFSRQFWQKQGTAVQGTWVWATNAGQTDFASVTGEAAGVYYNSTLANLDEYEWSDIFLVPGTYKITISTITSSNRGIMEVLFGTTSLGTMDAYTEVQVFNVVWTITFTLTAAQTADLRVRVNGKHVAAIAYRLSFSRFELEKIA